jgi:hypothetical protein
MMTDQEIKQANFWLRRWKMIGGLVKPRLRQQGLEIELHRSVDPDPAIEAAIAKSATALEKELLDNPKKHMHVAEIVRQHLHRQNEVALEVLARLGHPLAEVKSEDGPGDGSDAA